MKYEKEIRVTLAEFHEDWMDEIDKKDFIDRIIKENNINLQTLSESLEEDVLNGYSLEHQLNLIKIILQPTMKNTLRYLHNKKYTTKWLKRSLTS